MGANLRTMLDRDQPGLTFEVPLDHELRPLEKALGPIGKTTQKAVAAKGHLGKSPPLQFSRRYDMLFEAMP